MKNPNNYQAKISYQNTKVAENYDRIRFTSLRGKIGNWLEFRIFEKILSLLAKKSYILDMPCGTGRITAFLLEKGFWVTGADISGEMIKLAREKCATYPNLKGFCISDGNNLLFKDKQFDCVTSIRFMGHIPPGVRIKILKEMKRVCRKYIIVEYCILNPLVKIRRFFEQYFRNKTFDSRRWQILSRKELKEEIEGAGLKIVRLYPKMRIFSDAWILLIDARY